MWGKRGSARRLDEEVCVLKPIKAGLWRDAFFVWCSPRGLVEAPHDSGVGWKQFVMLLEEVLVCSGAAFHPPCASRVDERDSSV